MTKQIHVAAGVIVRGVAERNVEILLAKRPDHLHKGGLWEFPGGKVEAGESAVEALRRELVEELGITVQEAGPLLEVPYVYPEKTVLLDVYLVSLFAGEPEGKEGQAIRWVSLTALRDFAFPEANAPIVDYLLQKPWDY